MIKKKVGFLESRTQRNTKSLMEKDKICALIIVSNPVILYTRFQMLNIE